MTFETWVFYNVWIFFLITMLILQSAVSIVQAVALMCWHRRNLKKMKSGESIIYIRQNPFWRYEREIAFIIVLMGTSIFSWNEMREVIPTLWISIGIMLLFSAWIMYWRPTASDNWLAQLVGGIVIFLIIFAADDGSFIRE